VESYPYGRGGIFLPCVPVALAQLSDGASHTYLCGEKSIDANHYADGLDPGDQYCYCSSYFPTNVRYVTNGDGADQYLVPRQDMPGYSDPLAFGSVHAGMFNMAFCDGSVHQISYGIAPLIHNRLGNRADGNAVDASMY
jgi:prepilin-type processing-associated H-X9-DG protein